MIGIILKTIRKFFLSSTLRYALGVILTGLLFVNCSSTKKSSGSSDSDNSISSGKVDLKAPENLAPGTAQVRLTVNKVVSENEDRAIWIAEIKEILGYGSATPPLGVAEELSINVDSYFNNRDAEPQDLADRDELICVIRHEQMLEGSHPANWSLVKVFEQ